MMGQRVVEVIVKRNTEEKKNMSVWVAARAQMHCNVGEYLGAQEGVATVACKSALLNVRQLQELETLGAQSHASQRHRWNMM
jgi:hypothetical protein